MKQKNIKSIIIFLGILIVLFTISYVLFLKSFIQNTTYYKPFSIEISGLDSSQFKAVNCYGITPKSRKIVLNRDDGNFSFLSNYYMHLSDVVFCCADSVFLKIKAIKLSIHESPSSYYLDMDNIVYNEKLVGQLNGFQIINFKEHVHPNYSNIKVFFAIFLWPGFRVLYIAFICGLLLFFIFWFRRPAFTLLKAIVQFLIKNFHKIEVKTRHTRLLFSLILCLIFCLIYFNTSQFSGVTLEMKESVTQTVAVNFAYGHGFPKSGFIENFNIYNFSQYDATGDLSYSFLNNFRGAYIYHNPPIYELFIGSVYYFSGINPLLLKQIQLLILIITISLLPLLGFKLAGKLGFWSGLISAPIALNKYAELSNQFDPDFLIILFLFVLAYVFQKSMLEEKYFKVIIIGLLLSFIILTQLTFILLPFFVILYLFYILIKKPSRRAIIGFFILIISFTMPIFIWSQYASNHLNIDLIKENNSSKIHNTLLNRNFSSNDISNLEGLENYFEIKNNDTIINDGGWIGPLSVYENDLVDNIVIPSLFYNKRILIATKSAPDLLLIAHNEYCTNGNPSTDWTKHSDSYYNNDNKSLSPYFRVFLFYLNHPKQLFSGAINKLYNGFSSFNYLFIVIWIYVINSLFFYLQALFQRKNQKYIRATKIFISLCLLIISLCVININYIVFYSTLIALFILILKKTFNRKIHDIKTPEVFIIVLLSLLFFVIATFGLERYIIVINFIFVYQAIYSLLFFSFSNNNNSPNSINT